MFGAPVETTDVLVWPDMKDAVMLFFGLSTQWRWVGVATGLLRTGLDYAALPAVATAYGITPDAGCFADLRTMEGEALSVLNRK